MHLIHDLVEIHAGDTFAYDEAGHEDKEERERAAADRIFVLLPDAQGQEMRALWDEFEERVTPESRYAAALDRLHPLLLNYHADAADRRRTDRREAGGLGQPAALPPCNATHGDTYQDQGRCGWRPAAGALLRLSCTGVEGLA